MEWIFKRAQRVCTGGGTKKRKRVKRKARYIYIRAMGKGKQCVAVIKSSVVDVGPLCDGTKKGGKAHFFRAANLRASSSISGIPPLLFSVSLGVDSDPVAVECALSPPC